jgi:pilus assembly protein CpaE
VANGDMAKVSLGRLNSRCYQWEQKKTARWPWMAFNLSPLDSSHRPDWTWKIGLVLESEDLTAEIRSAIAAAGATPVFTLPAGAPAFEIANAVERDRPDILFVELARASKPAADWMMDVRRGEQTPLVIAVHPAAEPAEMISALRAGASEFVSLPVRPAIYDALDRIAALLEARRSATVEPGRIAGILSPKGGCGATSIACYLSAAMHLAAPSMRILVADLDYQSPGAHHVFRIPEGPGSTRRANASDAFEAVRRLNTASWREFITSVAPGVDLLASPAHGAGPDSQPVLPEQWRVESLFRFIIRQYTWVLADLGRHLNPASWTVLQNIDELFIVTAPDVLALYQTRSVLQTLSNRGFEKNRVRIILNRNMTSPQDFWVESIQQMFEMPVFGLVPNDEAALEKLPRDRFEFPAETSFGRAVTKMAGRIVKSGGVNPAPGKKAA